MLDVEWKAALGHLPIHDTLLTHYTLLAWTYPAFWLGISGSVVNLLQWQGILQQSKLCIDTD